MPFAFGHLLSAWIPAKIYEWIFKKKLNHHTWFFLLFGAIIPDVDFLLDWTLGTDIHRTLTHSLLFIPIMFLLVYLLFFKSPHRKQFALAMSLGIIIHIAMDMFSGVLLFWPSQIYVSWFAFNQAPEKFLATANRLSSAVLDMALGTAWIFYLWWRKQLKF